MSGITKLTVYRDSVSLYYTHNQHPWRLSMGISLKSFDTRRIGEIKKQLSKKQDLSDVFPEEWSDVIIKKQRIDNVIKDFNLNHNDYPTVSELTRLVKSITENQDTTRSVGFTMSSRLIEVFDAYIEVRMKGVRDGQLSPQTNKDVLTFKNSLFDFQKDSNREFIVLDITESWIKDLFNYLKTKRGKRQGFHTVGGLNAKSMKKRFDTLKHFTHWLEDNHNISLYHNVKKIVGSIKLKGLEEDVVKYALNNEQLRLIREFPLDEGSPLCKARDMFMVVCYTGMRFGDLETLEKKHILTIGDLKVLKRKAVKTSNKVYEVELHRFVVELLEKYDYKMNLMTNGKANEYIKKVLAGIDEFCTESTLYFGDDGLPKKLWELIGFHQGRRTFITNLFKKGLNPFQVMKRTDHTKISTLEDYIAPSKDKYENPEELFGFC